MAATVVPTRGDPDLGGGLLGLASHLRELRRRALICIAALVAGTVVAFVFRTTMLQALTSPYCSLPGQFRLVQGQCTLIVTGVLDAFRVTLKLSLYAGVLLSAPVWLFQIWRFITPGLRRNERRYASSFVVLSLGLFGLGTFFAYLMTSRGLHFLLGFATGGITPLLSFDSYLSFITAMVLIFGISFEFPLLVTMLNLAGVLSAARLRSWTRGILFGVVVFASIATPSQDPFTMLALIVPLWLLYGASFGFAVLHDRRLAARRAAEEIEHESIPRE